MNVGRSRNERTETITTRRRRDPKQILPTELWLLIFTFADIQTLSALKDVCKQFKEWTMPLLIRLYFNNYPILWRLFLKTTDSFFELNPGMAVPDDVSTFIGDIHKPIQLSSVCTIPPFVLRLLHLMHKNIFQITDEIMCSLNANTVLIPNNTDSNREEGDFFSARTPDHISPIPPSPSSSTPPSPSFHHFYFNSPTDLTLQQQHPPAKYTDRYEEWADYNPLLAGLDRESNYNQFRSEVGRRGSGVLSKDYVRWESNKREIMRRLAVLVAKVWCIISGRRFPFSHAENRVWKERRKRRDLQLLKQNLIEGSSSPSSGSTPTTPRARHLSAKTLSGGGGGGKNPKWEREPRRYSDSVSQLLSLADTRLSSSSDSIKIEEEEEIQAEYQTQQTPNRRVSGGGGSSRRRRARSQNISGSNSHYNNRRNS